MKIIKAGYEFINEPSITKKIERIARICYKSEDKIGEGTDLKMIRALIKRQHTAMLEHGDVCMEVAGCVYELITDITTMMENAITKKETDYDLKRCHLRRTSHYCTDGKTRFIVSGNMRAWYEFFLVASELKALPEELYRTVNEAIGCLFDESPIITKYGLGVYDDVWGTCLSAYVCNRIIDFTVLTPKERMVHETFSVLFTVDRGVTHEMVRHRDECSFAQESTRYCNYNLGKFGNEITVIEPCFYSERDDEYNAWVSAMEDSEKHYFDLINAGSKPQEARTVLPTSTKADIVMTATLREWKHIFNLRACDSTGPAHPQIKEVMVPLLKDMQTSHSFAYGTMIPVEVK